MNLIISRQEYYEDIISRNFIEKLEESQVLSDDAIIYYKYPFVSVHIFKKIIV